MNKNQIEEFVSDSESMRLFQQERLIMETTERICEVMDKKGVSRKKLADALGTSKSFISQLLDGSRNLTLRTLSDVFLVLGFAAHVHTGSIQASVKSRIEFNFDVDEESWSRESPYGDDIEMDAPRMKMNDLAA